MNNKKSGGRIWLALINVLFLIAAAVCIFSIKARISSLYEPGAAESWQGESNVSFSRVSCFIPANESFDLQQIYAVREKVCGTVYTELADESGVSLFYDCWSAEGQASVSSDYGSGSASVIAAGGNYFRSHNVTLLSGSFFGPDDLMQDRVLIDSNLAWLLFGGNDVQGLSVKINGYPFVIAGVFEFSGDKAYQAAVSDEMCLIMPFESYAVIDENAKISCYEAVLANPVKGFAELAVKDAFPVNSAEIICDDGRFSLSGLFRVIGSYGTRSMQKTAVAYPYWENAALYTEDVCALLLLLTVLFLICPAVTLIVLIIKFIIYLRDTFFLNFKSKLSGMFKKKDRNAPEAEGENDGQCDEIL